MSKADLKKSNEKRLKVKVGSKHKKDTKLKDLERQLEFAECRCGALKQQLDYIKALYGEGKLKYPEKQVHREEGHGDGSNLSKFTLADNSRWDKSEENFENRGTPAFRPDDVSCASSELLATKRNSENEHKKKDKHKNHLKVFKSKKKISKKGKSKSKKSSTVPLSKVSHVSSQTQNLVGQDPVVEIYKNSALNAESESGLEIVSRGKHMARKKYIPMESLQQKDKFKTVDCESKENDKKIYEDFKVMSCNSINTENLNVNKSRDENFQNGMQLDVHLNRIKENVINEFQSKRNFLKSSSAYFESSRNYWQPTISSKRKQTEKDVYSNLKNMNIRNIPFVAAKSTAPSHNINVNIQQVLSIIKKRQRFNDTFLPVNKENEVLENSLINNLHMKRQEDQMQESSTYIDPNLPVVNKKRSQPSKSSLSHWKSNTNFEKPSSENSLHPPSENQSRDWNFKVNKLKRVLMFLHEDFTFLSQKYKKLQKKLTKRNISKTDAKDELAEIERSLEKKEEEIIVVIGLYKEVLNLREDFKKLQEKYDSVTYGRTSVIEGLKQSTSTHAQMTMLLRKIQNLQDQLKN